MKNQAINHESKLKSLALLLLLVGMSFVISHSSPLSRNFKE
jgi:hypothetical protein